MKKALPTFLIIITGCFFITATVGCKKITGIKDPVTLDEASGTWSINAVWFNASYGSGATRDSLIPWKPILGNWVTFDGISKMEYCFNRSYKSFGSYKLENSDSMTVTFTENNRVEDIDYLVKIFGGETSKWKIRLLTPTNFNIEKTVESHSAFPGATTVKIYQNFVR